MLLLVMSMPALAVEKVTPVKVRGAAFYLEQFQPDMSVTRTVTTRIPNEPDRMCYRWLLMIAPQPGIRRLREQFTLPDTPRQWDGVEGAFDSPTLLSKTGRVANTDFYAALDRGEITRHWCVAEGDPLGAYEIEIFDGEKSLHRFKFDMVEP